MDMITPATRRGRSVLDIDELPDILVRSENGRCTKLQIEHIRFLYVRTTHTMSDICVMVRINMCTLTRIVQRNQWPLRQPKQQWNIGPTMKKYREVELTELQQAIFRMAGIVDHPGYIGAFTRKEADGAIPNGERVEKTFNEVGDANPLGTKGTVMGSIAVPDHGILYFIEWDSTPRTVVSTADKKITRC